MVFIHRLVQCRARRRLQLPFRLVQATILQQKRRLGGCALNPGDPSMIRTSLFLAASAFLIAPLAHADHGRHGGYYGPQPTVASAACERQKSNDKLAGGIVGAVAGGLIGAAIGGELEPDNGFNRSRGYRGYRGYRGHRGYRGYRRGGRGFYHDRGDDGAEIAGAVVGGLLGAAVGSSVAGDSTNCSRTYSYEPSGRYQNAGSWGNQYAPTRSPTGPAWENPEIQQSRHTTSTRTVSAPAYPSEPAYPSVPAYPSNEDYGLAGAPEARTGAGECTTVRRETRLPDGTVIREPVEVCQTQDGRWQMPEPVPGY